MLALRVPCDARMSWRGANLGYALRQAHPETPANPALLGKPERVLRSKSTPTSTPKK
jgi:hypothetical protein